jgi:D-sedoheptulose 7-phosphate isomerase
MEQTPSQIVERELAELADIARNTAAASATHIAAVAELAAAALGRGNKLLFCGNGGSAADAQHLAAEYVVRLRDDRRALPAIALTTDSSLLTAAANDYGFERVFARQVEALGRAGDVLFLHTTSGDSTNLVAAAHAARAAGVTTIGMVARGGGSLRPLLDHAIDVPTRSGAHAQELHIAIGHIICRIVELRLGAEQLGAPAADAVGLLHEARLAEKRQALFYRALAAAAEDAGDDELSERLNGLHADEQHHLSRLTVRLVELSEAVADLGGEVAPDVRLDGWEQLARGREAEEVARYAGLLTHPLDPRTRAVLEQCLAAERHHAEVLGGKWMGAEP